MSVPKRSIRFCFPRPVDDGVAVAHRIGTQLCDLVGNVAAVFVANFSDDVNQHAPLCLGKNCRCLLGNECVLVDFADEIIKRFRLHGALHFPRFTLRERCVGFGTNLVEHLLDEGVAHRAHHVTELTSCTAPSASSDQVQRSFTFSVRNPACHAD